MPILAILVIKRVSVLYSSLDMGMIVSLEATFSSALSKRKSTKALHKLCQFLV